MFSIGDKVICIDGNFNPQVYTAFKYLPKENDIYTVRNVFSEKNAVVLKELVNPPIAISEMFVEPRFNANRFRKMDELDLIEQEIKEEELTLTK